MVSKEVSREKIIETFAALNPANIAPRHAGCTTFFFPVEDHVLRVDLFHGDLEWRAAVYRENSEILADRQDDNGIMVASEMDQALLVWIAKLVRGGTFKKRYEPLITQAYRANPAEFTARIEHILGPGLARQLTDLTASGRLPECVALSSACRRALWLGALRRHPFGTLGRYVREIGDAVEHRLHPSGLDVAIVGPDGAGQTTLCSTISVLPERRIPFVVAFRAPRTHRVPSILGTVRSRMLHRSQRPEQHHSIPQGLPPLNPVKWLISYASSIPDRWISELFWSRRKLAYGDLVLHDQHPLEVTINPLRYRYAGPMSLARAITRLAPKPALVIVLDAPAEMIQTRNHHLTLEEATRQRDAYLALARSLPNGAIVDATKPFDQVMRDVLRTITDYSAARTRRRFWLGPILGPANKTISPRLRIIPSGARATACDQNATTPDTSFGGQ
jgi:thymidylate kinase